MLNSDKIFYSFVYNKCFIIAHISQHLQHIPKLYFVYCQFTPILIRKKRETRPGGDTSPDFSLKKVVLAFEIGLVMGFSLTPGLQWSNQCNSGEVGRLY